MNNDAHYPHSHVPRALLVNVHDYGGRGESIRRPPFINTRSTNLYNSSHDDLQSHITTIERQITSLNNAIKDIRDTLKPTSTNKPHRQYNNQKQTPMEPTPHATRRTILPTKTLHKNFSDDLFPCFKILRSYVNNRHSFRNRKQRISQRITEKTLNTLCTPIFGRTLASEDTPLARDTRKNISNLVEKAYHISNDFYLSHYITVDFNLINDFKSHFNIPNPKQLGEFINTASNLLWNNLKKRKGNKGTRLNMYHDINNI
jgi:hypothetical protein